MKKLIWAMLTAALCGCSSTIRSYDENGKLLHEEQISGFSRMMDGTNQKSQLVLIDGTYIGWEMSATAGSGFTPGVVGRFAGGKTALVNARSDGNFSGVAPVVENFFAGKVDISADGIRAE